MNLEELARIVRAAVGGHSRPMLATVGGGETPDTTLDAEFTDAIRSLAARKSQVANRPDEPGQWI